MCKPFVTSHYMGAFKGLPKNTPMNFLRKLEKACERALDSNLDTQHPVKTTFTLFTIMIFLCQDVTSFPVCVWNTDPLNKNNKIMEIYS
jgi:hypothetical protein